MLPVPARSTTDRLTGRSSARRTATGPFDRRVWAAAGAAAVLLLTGACGGGSAGAGASAASSTAPTATSPAADTAEVTVSDAWVKATEGAQDPTMTAAFAVLTNTTDRPVTVVSATTSASDRAELHEMAMVDGSMVMRPKTGGFVVPAGGSTTLQPGGDHVMIMDVGTPVRPGDQVTVALTLDDGSTTEFTALAKDFAGAQEEYAGSSGSASAGMQMSGGMPSTAAAGG